MQQHLHPFHNPHRCSINKIFCMNWIGYCLCIGKSISESRQCVHFWMFPLEARHFLCNNLQNWLKAETRVLLSFHDKNGKVRPSCSLFQRCDENLHRLNCEQTSWTQVHSPPLYWPNRWFAVQFVGIKEKVSVIGIAHKCASYLHQQFAAGGKCSNIFLNS